jgi:long-chain fatty acid transport protein
MKTLAAAALSRGFGGGAPIVTASALLALVPSLARANEPDTYGLGSRAAAMGGAVAADAADFSGNYYNPAALAGARGPSVSVGYAYIRNHLSIDGRDNGVAPVHGLVGGLALPGTLFGVPFAFGVGLYLPDTGISSVAALRQETPRWVLYQERSSIIFVAANLAVRPFPWLEVGGGVAFLAATKGKFQISGTADALQPYDSQLRHQVDADLSSVRYPEVGARFAIPGFGRLAAVYRGQSVIDVQLTAHLQGTVDFAGVEVPLVYDLSTRIADAFLPQQVVLGASFQRVPRLKVNVDVVFVNWAAFPNPTAATVSNLSVRVPAGLPVSLPPSPQPVTLLPPRFADRYVPHLGVEYVVPVAGGWRRLEGDPIERRAVEIPLRAGYVYERSPVPPQTGVTNFVDADRHTVSLGAGVTLNAPGSVLAGSLTLDLHEQLSILPERVTLKDNPADFAGDYKASGTMVGIGATLTAVF